MTRTRNSFIPLRLLPVVLGGVFTASLGVAPGGAQDLEVRASMQIETAGQPPMHMEYAVGGGRLRMDMAQGVSMIWVGGDQPSMTMIQHTERRYIEWGPDQLKMMQQMMQRMPGADGANDASDLDPSQLRFEETGNRERIGEWDAFEVRMSGMESGQTGMLWMTNDLEIGLFELTSTVAEATGALSMPMAGGGGLPNASDLARYQAIARAGGMPDGVVVRALMTGDGKTTTMTLLSVVPGPPPAGTFDPPSDYERMQMPSIPGGLPGE